MNWKNWNYAIYIINAIVFACLNIFIDKEVLGTPVRILFSILIFVNLMAAWYQKNK